MIRWKEEKIKLKHLFMLQIVTADKTNFCPQPDSKFFTDSVNLNSSGMKRLTKNWEAIIHRLQTHHHNAITMPYHTLVYNSLITYQNILKNTKLKAYK